MPHGQHTSWCRHASLNRRGFTAPPERSVWCKWGANCSQVSTMKTWGCGEIDPISASDTSCATTSTVQGSKTKEPSRSCNKRICSGSELCNTACLHVICSWLYSFYRTHNHFLFIALVWDHHTIKETWGQMRLWRGMRKVYWQKKKNTHSGIWFSLGTSTKTFQDSSDFAENLFFLLPLGIWEDKKGNCQTF